MAVRRSFLLVAALAFAASACFGPPGGGGGGGGGGSNPTGDQNGSLGSCPVFPVTAQPGYVGWNDDVSARAADQNSDNYIANILANGGDYLHADFGGGGAYGIPYVTVPGTQPGVPINFTMYGDESDSGPYPVPLGAPIEGGASSTSDRHVIAVDRDNCVLYEMYRAFPRSGYWDADSGAKWDLRSNNLRTLGYTSAGAAGLPIFAGLVRYDEVASGHIDHALRFTVNATQRGYILPATHSASSSTDPNRPPMGLRLRLDPSYTLGCTCPQSQVIVAALKKYGMIVADNGSNWFITGASDTRRDDNDLNNLKTIPGGSFTVVDTGAVQTG